MSDPIIEVTSKDAGRNAVVRLYPDRIEREKPRSRSSWSRTAQDVEVTPIKSVSSVQASKDGLSTKVTVYASGNTIEFRIHPHDDAHRFKDEILKLVLGGAPTSAAAPATSVLDQLKTLGELRDSGVLTAEEFETQKAALLAPAEAPPAPSSPSSSGGSAGRIAGAVATGGLSEAARFGMKKLRKPKD